jgi:hypothetical protein
LGNFIKLLVAFNKREISIFFDFDAFNTRDIFTGLITRRNHEKVSLLAISVASLLGAALFFVDSICFFIIYSFYQCCEFTGSLVGFSFGKFSESLPFFRNFVGFNAHKVLHISTSFCAFIKHVTWVFFALPVGSP